MIEFIQGELQLKGANYIILQVGGIGYRLSVPTIIMNELPPIRTEVNIFTYLHVREDELSLYGFSTLGERETFTTLLQVSGVGPKLALAILSHLPVVELQRAIIWGDHKTLTTVPGVGKKMAGRLILELKDKLAKEAPAEKGIIESGIGHTDKRTEVIAALLSLGYSMSEVQRAIPTSAQEQDYAVPDLIRLALKNIAKY